MPEGPEVRRYADELENALAGKKIIDLKARTKNARAWLAEHHDELVGKTIESVFAHGKNIIGTISGDYFFYSHQMMWGRWHIQTMKEATIVDKRERARIVVRNKVAVLMSAPIFEVGFGNPYDQIKYLRDLGPNVLSYDGKKFDAKDFLRRLEKASAAGTTIGAALLDQSIVAGIGNYLRAEIMFVGKIDPWTKVSDLSAKQKKLLCTLIPQLCERAYERHGVTVPDELQERMRVDPSLVYILGKEYGTHHFAFRRTNLPCLICDEPIRQLRQTIPAQDTGDEKLTANANDEDDDEKSRIVYFCANCQSVDLAAIKAEQPKVRR